MTAGKGRARAPQPWFVLSLLRRLQRKPEYQQHSSLQINSTPSQLPAKSISALQFNTPHFCPRSRNHGPNQGGTFLPAVAHRIFPSPPQTSAPSRNTTPNTTPRQPFKITSLIHSHNVILRQNLNQLQPWRPVPSLISNRK